MKVIIVGGVAGGASCAARLRRLDEKAEILMVERGPYVSYANCGLPYHIGGVIEKESSLLVADAADLPHAICDRRADRLRGGRRSRAGQEDRAAARRRDWRGDVPSPTTSWCCRPARRRFARRCPASTCPESSRSEPCLTRGRSASGSSVARRFCGHAQLLRLPDRAAEDPRRGHRRRLHRAGDGREPGPSRLRRDADRDGSTGSRPARPRKWRASSRDFVEQHGVRLVLDDGVAGFKQADGGALDVETKSGKVYRADVVILALGVRPDTALAKRRASRSASAAASASTTRCAPTSPTSSPSAMPSR